MNSFIVIKTSFEALHNWPGCDIPEVSFLRNTHRHIFHIIMKWPVYHNDRDKEFIFMKRKVNEFIKKKYEGKDLGSTSCEMIAEKLIDEFVCSFVSVFEDNENGVEYYV